MDAAVEIAHVAVNVLRLRSNYNTETLRQPAKETLSAAFLYACRFYCKNRGKYRIISSKEIETKGRIDNA